MTILQKQVSADYNTLKIIKGILKMCEQKCGEVSNVNNETNETNKANETNEANEAMSHVRLSLIANAESRFGVDDPMPEPGEAVVTHGFEVTHTTPESLTDAISLIQQLGDARRTYIGDRFADLVVKASEIISIQASRPKSEEDFCEIQDKTQDAIANLIIASLEAFIGNRHYNDRETPIEEDLLSRIGDMVTDQLADEVDYAITQTLKDMRLAPR